MKNNRRQPSRTELPVKNDILRALLNSEYKHLRPMLERVDLKLGEVGQRLARWLLTMHDHAESNEFEMPHKSIAAMLGARREGVTEEAVKLQASGLITYRRARIQILNEAGLKKKSCECYGFIRGQFDGLLKEVPAFLSRKPRISRYSAR